MMLGIMSKRSHESLASTYPELAAEWHPSANGTLTPNDVAPKSRTRVWWRCAKCGHEWQSPIHYRSPGRGCANCGRERISEARKAPRVGRSLAEARPDLALEWDSARNAPLTAADVAIGSVTKYHWLCGECGASWLTAPGKRINPGCNDCSRRRGSRQKATPLPGESLLDRAPDLFDEWNFEKNDDLLPEHVRDTSHRRVWWRCEYGHEWQAAVYSRARGIGCPYCSGNAIGYGNDLVTVRPDLAAEWDFDRNGDLDPSTISPWHTKKVWWRCSKEHPYDARPSLRSQGIGCPYCANLRVGYGNDLRTLHPLIADEWHPSFNGDLRPEAVVAGSHLNAWWRCRYDASHEWMAKVRTRTRGAGCPKCHLAPRSAIEIRIEAELRSLLALDEDYRVQVGQRSLLVDMKSTELDLVIEFDGSWWHRSKEQKDANKTALLVSQGWRVVRIREAPLCPITELDVSVPTNSPVKMIVNAVLDRLEHDLALHLPRALEYRQSPNLWASADANDMIDRQLKWRAERRGSAAGRRADPAEPFSSTQDL